MSNQDHAARLREIAERFRKHASDWRFRDMHEVAKGLSEDQNSILAGADALERVAVLERELAEARKPCPCRERDARIEAAMDVLEEGFREQKGDTNAEGN
jgi:hypothetical protein